MRRSASALCGSTISVLLTLGLAIACSNQTDRSGSDGTDRSGDIPLRSELAATDEVFRWPTDPRDPILELDIELPSNAGGTIEIELVRALAPRCVDRIVALVEQSHYDGTTFHRVIPGFMIQGGDPKSRDQDPTNDGKGGDVDGLPDEPSAAPFERGVVALANKGRPGSNSSQIFIMVADHPELDGRYTILGRLTSGIEVVDRIASTETDRVGRWGPKDRPVENVVIRRASTRATDAEPSAPDHPAAIPAASPQPERLTELSNPPASTRPAKPDIAATSAPRTRPPSKGQPTPRVGRFQAKDRQNPA